MLDIEQGTQLVEIARDVVENYLQKEKTDLKKFEEGFLKEKKGVFVTIETWPEKKLRGCIGFPQPTHALGEAVQSAALSAAFEDPRFPPMQKDELKKIVFEISVLTVPELVAVKNSSEYCKKIKIGKDGLIMQNGSHAGLLLPQVATEYNWSAEEFLDNLARKAGLTPDFVHEKNTKIWKFQVQIFAEKKPCGEVEVK